MKWWYFERDGVDLVLVSDAYFEERPLDANPSNGNPHTPWYKNQNHFDDEHVHVKASNYEAAYKKALSMISMHQ